MYENQIKELKSEEENIIKVNEEKISKLSKSSFYKDKTKKQFNEEISALNKKAESQQATIKELENNIESLLKKKEDQKNRFQEKEKSDKKNYNELLRRYNELHKRVSDFKLNEETKENEINSAQNLMSNHISAKEDLEMYLHSFK
jgi:chromosome segregation ATPase